MKEFVEWRLLQMVHLVWKNNKQLTSEHFGELIYQTPELCDIIDLLLLEFHTN